MIFSGSGYGPRLSTEALDRALEGCLVVMDGNSSPHNPENPVSNNPT